MWGGNLFLVSCIAFNIVTADIYIHSPRGSNNRLNEQRAKRQNANRAFDSQNNDRGGHNVGDLTAEPHTAETGQYRMTYFQSGSNVKSNPSTGQSIMHIEWTNQHGCGGNEETDPGKANCNVVIQYMCMAANEDEPAESDRLRNGFSTETQDFTQTDALDSETQEEAKARKGVEDPQGGIRSDRVLQESWESYDRCSSRDRNKGLFLADQRISRRKTSAIYTRQNRNGNRRGYECPEERDYYPYWHPTDWKDIAVFADKKEHCETYQKESFNVKPRGECMIKYADSDFYSHASSHNNPKDCESNDGKWIDFTNFLELDKTHKTEDECLAANDNNAGIKYGWGIPLRPTELKMISPGIKELSKTCLVLLDEPHCEEAPRTRVNHLGNTKSGNPIRYSWTIPYFPSKDSQNCLLRVRYNISTDDYDPMNTDSSSNGNVSPVQNDPLIDIGVENQPLRLAINTAQFGRTFQDRTHLFVLERRPDDVDTETIHNIGVRGKRGNIVQTFPAVEYDFVPNELEIKEGDLVQIQWEGSNTHDNNAPGGDGQTGDDGEGADGTDRHNVVEMQSRDVNYPMPYENAKLFASAKIRWAPPSKPSDPSSLSPSMTGKDVASRYASAGFYECHTGCKHAVTSKDERMDNKLNNANASYRGMLLQFAKGKYFYACTRNNNFTNRSQKGTITVS